MSNQLDQQYKEITKEILHTGFEKNSRAGETLSVYNCGISHDMSEGFPLLTLRPVSLRIAFEEMMFFFRGETDTKKLEEKGITIWKGNTSREFLDSRGLKYLSEGDMGRGYGWQIRNFGGDSTNIGADQLYKLVETLTTNPDGRRHIITHWNPNQINQASLPPCHLYQQYYITGDKLNSFILLRSWDFYHGAPYNIAGYGFILTALSKLLKKDPGMLHITGVDTHLYNTQMCAARELIAREPKELPKLFINKDIDSIDDFLNLQFEDITLENYNPHPAQKKIPMAV